MNSLLAESRDLEADAPSDQRDEGQVAAEAAGGAGQETFAFEAMNLKVGDRLQVQPPVAVSTERSPVKLIGYLQDHSMLITAPTTGGSVPMQVMPGDQLIMRVFSGQNAFGFACDVQRVCKVPYSYLHISFPKKIQGTLIRKAARVRTKIIVKVRAEEGDTTEHTAVISNLSANGALLDGRRTASASSSSCTTSRPNSHWSLWCVRCLTMRRSNKVALRWRTLACNSSHWTPTTRCCCRAWCTST